MNIQIIYFLSTFVIVNTRASNLFHGSGCLILRAVLPVWYLVSSPTIHDPRGLATSTTLFFFFLKKIILSIYWFKTKKEPWHWSTSVNQPKREYPSFFAKCLSSLRSRLQMKDREGGWKYLGVFFDIFYIS